MTGEVTQTLKFNCSIARSQVLSAGRMTIKNIIPSSTKIPVKFKLNLFSIFRDLQLETETHTFQF